MNFSDSNYSEGYNSGLESAFNIAEMVVNNVLDMELKNNE